MKGNFHLMNKIDENWLEVPYRVQDLYVKYASDAAELVSGPQTFQGGWVLVTNEVGPVLITKRAFELMPFINQLPKALGAGMDTVQKAVGGPNPLTATLLGGALGAGLGYGGGWLANKLAPTYIGEDAARKWAIMGGLGMGAIPAFIHGYPNVKELGAKGWITPSRYQGRQGGADTAETLVAPENRTPAMEQELQDARDYDRAHPPIKETLAAACDLFGIIPEDDLFVEKAADYAGAALGAIPTDMWGRVIMYDPYLDDGSKAVASGLPYSASAASGSKWVSPMDVARVAGNTALGTGIGWGIGQVAKTFLGFTPEAQTQLQRAGMLAGAVRGVLGMLG